MTQKANLMIFRIPMMQTDKIVHISQGVKFVSLRTTATFDGKYEEALKAWADKEYRTTGNLVSGIVNSVIDGNPMKVPEDLAVETESELRESLQIVRGALQSLLTAGDFDGYSVAELAYIVGCQPTDLDTLVDRLSSLKREDSSTKKRTPKT